MANSGNIVKAKCDKDFTTLFNSVLRDDRISLRARGLLSYIISLPSDWVIQKSYLDSQIFPNVERTNEKGVRVQGEKREGRDAVFSAFNELVDFGYIQAIRKINPENGRSEGFDYIVYSYPVIQNRVTDNPISATQISEEPQLTKEIELQKKDTTKENIIKDSEPPIDSASKEKINAAAEDDFNWFWNLYPKKVSKKKAKSTFLKLNQIEILEIKENLESWIAYKPFEKYQHPHPTTFLNDKRWQDEIPVKKEFKKSYNENDPKHQW